MSKSRADEANKKTVRANDFRYIPCDFANLALRNDGIKLILGIEEVNGEVTELTGVQMSLETANGIVEILSAALERAKDEFGVEFGD